jgi:hypothetical protein
MTLGLRRFAHCSLEMFLTLQSFHMAPGHLVN